MRKRTGTRVQREAFHLTPRQEEVVGLMAKGYTNAQIADALGITLDGAKAHVSEIISRLGVTTREEAVAAWQAAGRRSWMSGLSAAGLVKVVSTVAGVAAIVAAASFAASRLNDRNAGLIQCPTYNYAAVPNQMADWAPFVNFDGRHYIRSGRLFDHHEIGAAYGQVALNVSETPPDRPAGALDCAAAFLPVGTTLHELKGFAPTFRLATADGELYQTVSMDGRGIGADLIDIENRVLALLVGPAGRSLGSRPTWQITDRPLVDELVAALHTGAYNPGIIPMNDGSVLHFRLLDGTTFVAHLSWRPDAIGASINGVIIPEELAARLLSADVLGIVE